MSVTPPLSHVGVVGEDISLTERDPVAGHVRHQSSLHRVAEDLTPVRVGVSVAARPAVHLRLDEDRVGPGGVDQVGAGAGHGDVALGPPALQCGLAVNTVTVPLLQLGRWRPHVAQDLPAGAGRGGRRRQGRLGGQQGGGARLGRGRPGVVRGRGLALLSPEIYQVSAAHTSLTAQT